MIRARSIPSEFIVSDIPYFLKKGYKTGIVSNDYALVCDSVIVDGIADTIQELSEIQRVMESIPVKRDLDAMYARGEYYRLLYSEEKIAGAETKLLQGGYAVQLTAAECFENFSGRLMQGFTQDKAVSDRYYFSFRFSSCMLPFFVMQKKLVSLFGEICDTANLNLSSYENELRKNGDLLILEKFKRIASEFSGVLIMDTKLMKIAFPKRNYPYGIKPHDEEALKSLICFRFEQWFDSYNGVLELQTDYDKDAYVRTDLILSDNSTMLLRPFPKYTELELLC